jgi:hypothetical protein
MTLHQKICTAEPYLFYRVAKAAQVCVENKIPTFIGVLCTGISSVLDRNGIPENIGILHDTANYMV